MLWPETRGHRWQLLVTTATSAFLLPAWLSTCVPLVDVEIRSYKYSSVQLHQRAIRKYTKKASGVAAYHPSDKRCLLLLLACIQVSFVSGMGSSARPSRKVSKHLFCRQQQMACGVCQVVQHHAPCVTGIRASGRSRSHGTWGCHKTAAAWVFRLAVVGQGESKQWYPHPQHCIPRQMQRLPLFLWI
jgi:hypothetical protein